MALLRALTRLDMQRPSIHDEAVATFASFELGGQRYLQIDSYGRAEREMPGKKSQSIQVNRRTAEAIIAILRQEFDLD